MYCPRRVAGSFQPIAFLGVTRGFESGYYTRFRLGGGHEMPWPPGQPTTTYVVHPASGEVFPVLSGRTNVGDHQAPAWTQHPHGFLDGFLPVGSSADVVDGQTGDDHVETAVGKGQRRHVRGVQFDTIGDPFGDGVALGGFEGIAGLIESSPQVHTHGPAGGQMLRGHEQDGTAAASEIENSFITPKVQLVEQAGPNHKLASQRAVQIETQKASMNVAGTNVCQRPEMMAMTR